MHEYVKELEDLIANTLLPAYIEHYRLLGRPNPTKDINKKILQAMRTKKKVAVLLQKTKYA